MGRGLAGTVEARSNGAVRFWLGDGPDEWIDCRPVGDLRSGTFRLEVHGVGKLIVRPTATNEVTVGLESGS